MVRPQSIPTVIITLTLFRRKRGTGHTSGRAGGAEVAATRRPLRGATPVLARTGGSDDVRTGAILVRIATLLEREPALRPANDARRAAWPFPWLNNFCKEQRRDNGVVTCPVLLHPQAWSSARPATGRPGSMLTAIRTCSRKSAEHERNHESMEGFLQKGPTGGPTGRPKGLSARFLPCVVVT